MSDELAQDDEGFEITDFGVGEEDDDDPESAGGHRADGAPIPRSEPRYDPPPAANTAKEIPRESLDGETIFAVGEDGDKWSDEDELDEEEGKKLVDKPRKDPES